MMSSAETPIDATLIGTVPAPDRVEPLPEGRLAVWTDHRLEIHDRDAFLAGNGSPLHAQPLPPDASATPLPAGGLVAAETARIRRIGPDGRDRWEVAHAPWHGSQWSSRPPGSPAVSPDGRHVSVVVPTLAAKGAPAVLVYDDAQKREYARDTLLLLDAATGEVLARRPIGAVASDVTQRWHPDGSLLALSCWTAWHSWSTWWIEPRHDGLHIRGGAPMREVIDFVPGASRVLTIRRAEGIAPNDDRDELASHEMASDDPHTLIDLGTLAVDPDNDEFSDAFLLDSAHVLVTGQIYLPGRPATVRHWLCDAATLKPLGRVRYPAPVGCEAVPLGDGSWLTRRGERMHHWALP
ncbi:hypothetical protein AB0M39_29285 [Streptomyces sp. NPDC051907]|uniref:hypothetical protein n=1 Tax=Streptomyces sp. NPDC051907 TaxID=3155284 RepID=UPI00343DAA07